MYSNAEIFKFDKKVLSPAFEGYNLLSYEPLMINFCKTGAYSDFSACKSFEFFL
jgi:hypothetical protein